MKTSKDNKQIPDRIWYYLLDWNEEDNWKTIKGLVDTARLSDLEYNQIIWLFAIATNIDYKNLKDKI